jgi:hypothetical protein
MILSTNANLWAIAGTVYALAGAALLCNAAFLSPAPQAGGQDDLFSRRRLYEQWLDCRIGAVLVVIGFFMQATGSLGTASLKAPAAFVLLGLCLASAYYAMMKGLMVETLMGPAEPQRQDRPLSLVHPAPVVSPAPVAPVAHAAELDPPRAQPVGQA